MSWFNVICLLIQNNIVLSFGNFCMCANYHLLGYDSVCAVNNIGLLIFKPIAVKCSNESIPLRKVLERNKDYKCCEVIYHYHYVKWVM